MKDSEGRTWAPIKGAATEGRFDVALVAVATLVALALRTGLALRSQVWLDEANSVLLALTPVAELADALAQDSSPPLYYLLLGAWARLTSLDPLWLRTPSILFGSLTVPAIWLVGRRIDRSRTGVLAAWLIALSPLHAYYSEEIRMYAMLVLLGLGFYFAVFDVMRRTKKVLPAVLLGITTAYTHYYGLIFVGSVLVVAMVAMQERQKRTLLCGGAIGIAFLPWLPVFLAQLENPHHISWIATYWEEYPRGMGVVRTLQAFTPGGLKYTLVPLQGVAWQPVVGALLTLPFLGLAIRPGRRGNFGPLLAPTLVIGVMLSALVVRSYTGAPIYLAGRSDIVLLPLFAIVLAVALARLGTRTQLLFVATWAVLAGLEVTASAEPMRKAGNLEMKAVLDDAGCETIIATGLSYAPLAYYEMLEENGARVLPYPIDMGEHPGNIDLTRYTPQQLAGDAQLLSERFPAGPATCLVAWAAAFPAPLGDPYLATGATARSLGVYRASMVTTDYILVRF